MWGMPGKQSPTSNTTLYRFWTRHAIPMRKLNDPAFIGRMVQHILPKGFHRMRYYGLHAALHQKSGQHADPSVNKTFLASF